MVPSKGSNIPMITAFISYFFSAAKIGIFQLLFLANYDEKGRWSHQNW
jgi:hypothetical protein